MLKGLYVLDERSYDLIYGEDERQDISKLVDISAPVQNRNSIRDNLSLLNEVDVIFSGWGGPSIDRELLDAAPNLKAVFYGAGSIKSIVTPEFWERDIIITSSYAANAIPVAEFTLSQILFALKLGWQFAINIKRDGKYPDKRAIEVPGGYRSTVGLISLGMIGRYVCDLLKPFDINILAYDPFVDEETAEELGVELCELDEIFVRSDVVSLHTPWLKETEGMIKGKHFELMRENGSFLNTARGAVVNEDEMIDVLKRRPDLMAILDVTYPEPPREGSPLYTLPNVVLTPHIAGSMNKECNRMGRYAVEELERYIKGEELKWQITKEQASILA